MIGVLLVSGFVPVLEQIVFSLLRRLPPEFEILRTLRYLVPLVLLAALYALWMAKDHLPAMGIPASSVYGRSFLATGVLLLAWGLNSQVLQRDFREPIKQNLRCWLQGRLVCPLPPHDMDFIAVLNAVREETPAGSRIFSEGQEVAVRYYALRPLAFTYKDGAPLAYTDQKQLLVWSEASRRMEELAFIRKFPFRHRAFVRGIVELARDTRSDYLLLQEPYDAGLEYPGGVRLVYSNPHYSLFRLDK
jgi:hypothetical protein